MTEEEGQRAVNEEQVQETKQLIMANPNVTTQPLQLLVFPIELTPQDVSIEDIMNENTDLRYDLAVSGGQHRVLAIKNLQEESPHFLTEHKQVGRLDAQVMFSFICCNFFGYKLVPCCVADLCPWSDEEHAEFDCRCSDTDGN